MFFSTKEDVFYRHFYRQQQQQRTNSNNADSMPQQQQQQVQYQAQNTYQSDQTIDMEPPQAQTQPTNANYAALQQQHYMPHAKLHSLERFAVPSSIMPPPAPQSHNHHDHLTNDHELSLNETDTEEENHHHHNEPQTPVNNNINNKFLAGGIQLEFAETPVAKHNNEKSIIDLNELDEAQLKQLKAEEEKQEQEYFNIEHLNRLYCQAQFLYKVRGKKLEEVTNRFTTYQEDMSREVRAMKHRLYLAEKEREAAEASVEQAHQLCGQYKAEAEAAVKGGGEVQERCEKLKTANRVLEQRLAETEEEIENLQVQISEQQKLDTMERVQEQHERFIEQMRSQYEKELLQVREAAAEAQKGVQEKCEVIRMLRAQLEAAVGNAERAAVERADTVNRLTKSLNDLQAKYDQDVLIAGYANK